MEKEISKLVVDNETYALRDDKTRANAMKYDTLGVEVHADKAEIYGESIAGSRHAVEVPAATPEKAGVMSAEDKTKLNRFAEIGDLYDLDTYTDEGIYLIETASNEAKNYPVQTPANSVLRLTVTKSYDGNNTVIVQVLNLNNNAGGEGNVYIRSCQNGEWNAWGKLQTNVEVGQVNTLDHLTDNGIYSGVFTDGTPTSAGTFYDTFVLIVINNYAVSIPTGNPQSISQLKYSLGLDGSISVASRKRDQYGYWDNWVSLDEKSLVEEEKTRAEQAEQKLANAIAKEAKIADEKIADEKTALVNGDTIVGQAREIHSRNGKTVTDSFLVRTTAGSGTIGDGVASLKSVGGNIVKNLVDGTFRGGTIPVVNGHTYYASAIARNESISFNGKTVSAGNEWGLLSIREKVTSSECVVSLTGNKSLVIDLTEMFCAGNEPTKEECDKMFGTMDALSQGLTIANPTEFKSIGFNQFNPENVLEGKAIVDNTIVSGDKKIAVIPCLPCKVGTGENNGYCIHGDFGEDIKVYLTPLNPMEVDGELYMHELTKDATTDTYVPQIKGYMLVEVPTTANLCAHFLWSEDKCKRDTYEPYFESKVELPEIPQMSEWGLAGIQSSGTLAADTIDFERGVYVKRIEKVDWNTVYIVYTTYNDINVFVLKDTGCKVITVYNKLSNAISDKYSQAKKSSVSSTYMKSGEMMLNGAEIFIYDTNYTSVGAFRAAMQGVMLYYELAEPEEYPLPKVDNNYISSDYGVELFDSVVPCNANNLYYMRSLAGETRNFLDRLMAGLGTSDATVVADKILAVVNPTVEPTNVEPETPIEE